MPIIHLELDNILCFDQFKVNFSYPNKLRKSLLGEENLKNISSFRYKKANVFVGSNASGKTSLVRTIWKILYFLNKQEKQILKDIINDNQRDSNIVLDIVEENNSKENNSKENNSKENNSNEMYSSELYSQLFRIYICLTNKKLENGEADSVLHYDCLMDIISINLKKGDSYEGLLKELESKKPNYQDYNMVLKDFTLRTGWNIAIPATEYNFDRIKFYKPKEEKNLKEYGLIVRTILQTLDPAIIDCVKSNEVDNAYIIKHKNSARDIILQDDMVLSSIPYLSSGTKYGINIANIIYAIKNHMSGIYLIDEQFSYVNSDIEKTIISLMISLLGDNEQIFITTHNYSVLTLGLPFHSFYFLKKDLYDYEQRIRINCASEIENRNNVSAKTIIDNDLFGSSPSIESIYEMFLFE